MKPSERLQQVYDSYAVDETFTARVMNAAKQPPARGRMALRIGIAAAVVLCLSITAAAAGLGLLERRLKPGDTNQILTGERVQGYLAEHVQDVALEGTVDGIHLIYTNLLTEGRFVYMEVLAEREDGQPLDREALDTDMFFNYLELSYNPNASSALETDTSYSVGWISRVAQLDDGTEESFAHYAVGLTLMQREGVKEYLTLMLTTPDTLTPDPSMPGVSFVTPGDVLDSVTVPLTKPEDMRSCTLEDGRQVKICHLGVDIQGLSFFDEILQGQVLSDGDIAWPDDYGVVLRDGSRISFLTNLTDLSWYVFREDDETIVAAALSEVIDPAEVVALYSPGGEFPVK